MAQLFGPEHHGLAPGHSNFGRDGWMAHKNMWLLIHPQPRSAVMLAIFTVLPFLYVVPMCLPRVELVPCWIFKIPGRFCVATVGGNQDGSVGKIFSRNHGAQAWVFWITWRHLPLCQLMSPGYNCRKIRKARGVEPKCSFEKMSLESLWWLNLWFAIHFRICWDLPKANLLVVLLGWDSQGSLGAWIWPIPLKLAWLEWQVFKPPFPECMFVSLASRALVKLSEFRQKVAGRHQRRLCFLLGL